LCWEEGDMFRGVGDCLQFGREELGWGRRRRNRGGESRQSVDILTFTDGITDEHVMLVYPSIILTVNGPCHYMEIPVWISQVILSVKSSEKISCHQTVSFFQNSIYSNGNSVSIYQRNYSVGIYRPNCWQNICRR
jgi:hypothetical protein